MGTSALLRRLVWIAVLSCLIPQALTSDDCSVGKAAASGTCGVVTALTTAGSIFACVGTLGIGCGLIAAAGVVGGICTAVTSSGAIDCGSSIDPAVAQKFNDIKRYLDGIQETVDQIHDRIEVGFFEAKYVKYINKIRAATSRYQLDVVKKSMDENGLIKDNRLVREWAEDVLGDCDYNVRGGMDIIQDMITGAQGITNTPSIYTLALEKGLCSEDLYDFVTSLIVEGSALAFIALELRGDGVHQADRDQLAYRLKTNKRMFSSECINVKASQLKLKYPGIWGGWGDLELCPHSGYAVGFRQRVEEDQGDGYWAGADDTALNSICLKCNTGGEVCSKQGFWGSWGSSDDCDKGFSAANFRFERRKSERGGKDDSAANDLKLLCGEGADGEWMTTGNGGPWGDWQGEQYCSGGQVICGIKTRVEPALGHKSDDSALNGVELVCCDFKWDYSS